MSPKQKKKLFATAAFFIVLGIFGFRYFYRVGLNWSGYAYTAKNQGKSPIWIGTYANDQTCREEASNRVRSRIKLEDGTEATAFACGLDCATGDLANISVVDLKCSQLFLSDEGVRK